MITVAFLLLFKSLFPPKVAMYPFSESGREFEGSERNKTMSGTENKVFLPTLSSLPWGTLFQLDLLANQIDIIRGF